MGRAMRTTRRAQWQRVGRRASGAGLAWHIWQEQNVPCGNGRILAHPAHGLHSHLRDIFVQNLRKTCGCARRGARREKPRAAGRVTDDSVPRPAPRGPSRPRVCSVGNKLTARTFRSVSRLTSLTREPDIHESYSSSSVCNSSSSTFQSGGFSGHWGSGSCLLASDLASLGAVVPA